MMCKGSDELVDGMRQLIQSSLRRNDWQTLIALPFADATVREGDMAYEPNLLEQRDFRVLNSLLIPHFAQISNSRNVFHSLEEEVCNILRLRTHATHCSVRPSPYKV